MTQTDAGGTTLGWKVVIDSTDPHAKAAFWAAALGYVVEDNRVLLERPLSAGAIPQETVITAGGRPAFRTLQAVRHPNMWSWPILKATSSASGNRRRAQR